MGAVGIYKFIDFLEASFAGISPIAVDTITSNHHG